MSVTMLTYPKNLEGSITTYALMAGVPACQIGWMSQHGERLDLPLTRQAQATCPATGQTYRLDHDHQIPSSVGYLRIRNRQDWTVAVGGVLPPTGRRKVA